MDPFYIGTGLDRISDLPRTVIDQILAFLPLKDVVRTSTLSKNWKEKWYTVPRIIIDEKTCRVKYGWRRLEGMLNYILTRHEGRIEKFSVLLEVRDSNNVKSWIWTLERKGIQELFIVFRKSFWNEVSSNLFSCQQLRKLSLSNCTLKTAASSSGGGFQSLISLELSKVEMHTTVFEKLISNSHLLEQLTLRNLSCIDHFQINVPKLKYFWFGGEFVSMCFNTPLLEVLSINSLGRDRYYCESKQFDLRFRITGFPSTIKELYLQCEFHMYLAACETITEVLMYSRLRTLELTKFCFEKVEQVLCLLSLIGSSVNLTILDITACGCKSEDVSEPVTKKCKSESTVYEPVTKFWEERNKAHSFSNQLKKLRVRSFHSKDPEMKLIQYIMTNSLALEEMTVEWMEEPKFDEDEVKRILQPLCKTSTQLNFIGVKHKYNSDVDDGCGYDSHDSYVNDSD